jgi:hypothetical protein
MIGEEKIRRSIDMHRTDKWYGDPADGDALEELLELRSRTRWIPVTEKLPEDDIECLVCDECGTYMAIMDSGWWWTDGHALDGITHWMPLPEPPEVKE